DKDIKSRMTRIFTAKQKEEFTKHESIKSFAFLEGKLPFLKNEITKLPVGKYMEEDLNQLIWSILKEGDV
ncbi:hypothetical protein ACFWDG_17775, partial [Peribacillus sp. NPDC060186]